MVLASPDGVVGEASGSVEGRILEEPRGSAGFGYDPLFFHPPSGKAFAELQGEEKNQVSHRARALAALRPLLIRTFSEPA
jgi:XTP/dITP diphosphohydrolase